VNGIRPHNVPADRIGVTVSVIIPTFRRWELLCDAIESVLQQTFSDWEIIVVNDAGGVPCGDFLELSKHPKITYVEHAVNQGLAAARNTGIQHSSGTFISYLDDDDILYPDHLTTLVHALTENNWDVAYTEAYEATYQIVGAEQRIIDKKVVFKGDFELLDLWQANTLPVLSVIHRRACLEKTDVFDPALPVLEDWDMWLRFSMFYQFHFVPAITAEYRVWGDKANMSQNTSDDKWMKVKCYIYLKYLKCSEAKTIEPVKVALRETVFWFFKVRLRWFCEMLSKPEPDRNIIDFLKYVRVGDWTRMFSKQPLRVVSLALRLMKA
jgi:glycosyltransferase involved in cell wall biosynthesis